MEAKLNIYRIDGIEKRLVATESMTYENAQRRMHRLQDNWQTWFTTRPVIKNDAMYLEYKNGAKWIYEIKKE